MRCLVVDNKLSCCRGKKEIRSFVFRFSQSYIRGFASSRDTQASVHPPRSASQPSTCVMLPRQCTCICMCLIRDGRQTVIGLLDQIPAWFMGLDTHIFAMSLIHLFHQSLATGVVPRQWKNAVLAPYEDCLASASE